MLMSIHRSIAYMGGSSHALHNGELHPWCNMNHCTHYSPIMKKIGD